jgi:nucleoside-diphosphate-sugar epimerase
MADIIMHAAGFGQPMRFMSAPLVAFKLNTFTTLKLLEKLKSEGKFLFISSSEIYSGLPAGKYSENQIGTTNTNHPRACYIEGKRGGETICNIYNSMGIDAYAIRLSLAYGPGTRKNDQRVLPALIEKGLNGSIELLDSGSGFRAFCYISDVVEMIMFIFMNGKSYLYNVGGLGGSTIKDLALTIGNILHVPVIVPKENNSISGAPGNVTLDMSRLFQEYPKRQFVSLEEGLNNTIEWSRNLRVNN